MRKKTTYRICLLLVIFSSLAILKEYFDYQKVQNTKIPSVEKIIKEKKDIDYKDSKEEKQEQPIPYINELPNYRQQYNNEMIMGKLEIPNLNISSLVTRTQNNSFYLNNNLYNQYDGLGVPFFDYRNISLITDKQINIYGHNTRNEKFFDRLPFINLEAYTNKNIFKHYKDIYLSIDETRLHYKVVAVKIIDGTNNEHMKLNFRSDENYIQHIRKLLQNTLYKESNLEITSEDRIIVLQVCHYNPPNTYLLIIGKEEK